MNYTEEQLKELWKKADLEEIAAEQRIADFITCFTDKAIKVRLSSFKKNGISVYVDFLKENGDGVFGASFDLGYKETYDWHKKENLGPYVFVSNGSIGSYTLEEDPAVVARALLIAELWKHHAELINLFESFTFEAANTAKIAQREYDREQYRIQAKAEEKAKQEAEAKLVAGFTYEETDQSFGTNEVLKYTITKVTPKRIYFDYTRAYDSQHGRYDSNDCWSYLGTETGRETQYKSCYVDKSNVIYVLTSGETVRYKSYLKDFLKGIATRERSTFEMTSFEPAKD